MPTPGAWVLFQVFGVAVVFAMIFQGGGAIKCWECNSLYDPNCADPFDNYTVAVTDCDQRFLPHLPNVSATLCRKIIQKVNDEYRYIRSCGWIHAEKKHEGGCYKKAGTFQVMVDYCNCETDECNSAISTTISWISLGVLFVVAFTMQCTGSLAN
ncbi:UPAR/Ly6 domain-containing protein crok-like [Tachypleus tridentatus]|uniref:UPAR/Ly6 domain-containing protein crok-like n=1 Tax=Tachypleus tridentatus TaxID=6853 RepID=UPI003FD111F8